MLLGHKMKFMMIILKVFVIVISFVSVYEMEAFQLLEILRCKCVAKSEYFQTVVFLEMF